MTFRTVGLYSAVFLSMPRGPYRRISQVDRDRLINAFVADQDWLQLADQLGVRRQTARSIVLRYQRTGERQRGNRGGRREAQVRVTAEIRQAIIAYVTNHPQTTLKNLADHLYREFNTRLSTSTLSRVLDGQLFSLKLVRAIPASWNTPLNKAARREYADWFTVHGVQADCVFIDEFRHQHMEAPHSRPCYPWPLSCSTAA